MQDQKVLYNFFINKCEVAAGKKFYFNVPPEICFNKFDMTYLFDIPSKGAPLLGYLSFYRVDVNQQGETIETFLFNKPIAEIAYDLLAGNGTFRVNINNLTPNQFMVSNGTEVDMVFYPVIDILDTTVSVFPRR